MDSYEIQAQHKAIRLGFIVTLIDTAWTLTRSAETLYQSGSPYADESANKARETWGRAASRTLSLDRREQALLNDKLIQIRAILDSLRPSTAL